MNPRTIIAQVDGSGTTVNDSTMPRLSSSPCGFRVYVASSVIETGPVAIYPPSAVPLVKPSSLEVAVFEKLVTNVPGVAPPIPP